MGWSYDVAFDNVSLLWSPLLTGVDEEDDPTADLPQQTRLVGNYPNPFNPRTEIHFELDREQPVRLQVFDLRGRQVRTLVAGTLPAGPHCATWNGRDDRGRALASGVYLYRLTGRGTALSGKMALMK